MIQSEKYQEYELMTNSDLRTIKVDIPNGPQLNCHNSWDYKTNLKETTFKTKSDITHLDHSLLKVIPLDLNPVSNIKVWIIKILRQPESNLKNDQHTNQPRRNM
jgi:hypothetical protein